MSTLVSKNVQIGADATATNNFTIYQPATPNGTLLIGNGNTGITSSLVTLTSAGNMGIGTSSPSEKLHIYGANPYILLQGSEASAQTLYMRESAGGLFFGQYGVGTRMLLDSSGNLGLGVTPSAWTPTKVLQLGGEFLAYSGVTGYLTTNAYYGSLGFTYNGTGFATRYEQTSGKHLWYTAPSGTAGNAITFTQAMTLDGTNLYVNATALAQNKNYFAYSAGNAFGEFSHESGVSSGIGFVNFRYNGVVIGSISQNGTTQVLYNVSSDHRLKDISGPILGSEAKDFIMALQPKQGTWKADDSRFVGFVAHEFQEVSPLSVTGTKDAVDEDGKPVMQAMQASSPEVMANLIAHIQNLEQRLAALEAA